MGRFDRFIVLFLAAPFLASSAYGQARPVWVETLESCLARTLAPEPLVQSIGSVGWVRMDEPSEDGIRMLAQFEWLSFLAKATGSENSSGIMQSEKSIRSALAVVPGRFSGTFVFDHPTNSDILLRLGYSVGLVTRVNCTLVTTDQQTANRMMSVFGPTEPFVPVPGVSVIMAETPANGANKPRSLNGARFDAPSIALETGRMLLATGGLVTSYEMPAP